MVEFALILPLLLLVLGGIIDFGRAYQQQIMLTNAAREGAKAELTRVNRDLDRLVQALLDGAPARTVKDRMAQLEAWKDALEAQTRQGGDMKVAMQPSMASVCREHVANLREALAQEGC